VDAARRNRVTVSCDANYRRKLWSVQEAQAFMKDIMKSVTCSSATRRTPNAAWA
jgi:2-dehydro-3-deoxygluconokinase